MTRSNIQRLSGKVLVALAVVLAFTAGGTMLTLAGNGNDNQVNNNQGGVEKVTICHYPPGNPENVQVITIGEPALDDHIENHGDVQVPAGTLPEDCPPHEDGEKKKHHP